MALKIFIGVQEERIREQEELVYGRVGHDIGGHESIVHP